VANSGVTVAA